MRWVEVAPLWLIFHAIHIFKTPFLEIPKIVKTQKKYKGADFQKKDKNWAGGQSVEKLKLGWSKL